MKKILLLLAEGFEIYEASIFIDIFGWNLIDGDRSTKLFTAGLRKNIISSFGINMTIDLTLDEIKADDYSCLLIPGGFEEFGYYKDAFNEKFKSIIKDFDNQKKFIVTICTGALPVANAGVLKGKNCTTYNKMGKKRLDQLANFGAIISEDRIVVSDNIITSCDPSTAVDVGFNILEKLTTKENAEYIKEIMGFNKNKNIS